MTIVNALVHDDAFIGEAWDALHAYESRLLHVSDLPDARPEARSDPAKNKNLRRMVRD